MGGDHAPFSVIEGAALALQKIPHLSFLFFGDQVAIEALLQKRPALAQVSNVIHCDDRVADDAKPSVALRQGKNTSMRKALDAVHDGRAVAVVSGGNTGALMAMAKLVLKTLTGVHRPAAASLMPTRSGSCVMLDLGANLECSAEELFQFAIMGDAFARAVLGIEYPRIGLLNVGEEANKGHPEIREAAQMLRDSELDINFCGFIEGNQISQGVADVIVSDGFSGNIALKTAEGTAKLIREFIKEAFNTNLLTRLSYLMAFQAMKLLRKRLDPRRYNGAMFLGLNGVAVKSHGGADEYAFSFAVRMAADLVQHRTNPRIIEELKLTAHSHGKRHHPSLVTALTDAKLSLVESESTMEGA
jgi:glycerol-3-phosphate acyltransferase PlsX